MNEIPYENDIRTYSFLNHLRFDDESYETVTSKEQITTELLIDKCFHRFQQLKCLDKNLPILNRLQHVHYLHSALHYLTQAYQCLDSSRPWLIYWILNSSELLNVRFDDCTLNDVIGFLIKCRDKDGGFGGGPGQTPHLAPTFAAVNALVIIGTKTALEAINKETLINFLWSVRETNGAFRMHTGGELDVRGAYCAISSAKLVNISKTIESELFNGTSNWIASCQTYEGGLGGAPDLEAHGGYTFCGIAALTLLGSTGTCDLKALLRWVVHRQMRYEGGFQGRTNKLVDGCYSYWQGAILPIVQALINKKEPTNNEFIKRSLFDRNALQEYILLCCQYIKGGLIDKPGKPPDLYHTCYTLSGLSIAQHSVTDGCPLVIGNPDNELLPTHPLHNIPPKSVWDAYVYFNEDSTDNKCSNNLSQSDFDEATGGNNKNNNNGDDEISSVHNTTTVTTDYDNSMATTTSGTTKESSVDTDFDMINNDDEDFCENNNEM